MSTQPQQNPKCSTNYPQVIVAGMSRTGTESMKRALEILYNGPAYHMSEVLNQPQHLQFWSNLVFERIKPEPSDWKRLFRGYVATTDMPSAYYFRELTTVFPRAKVVLTVRDENDWFESYCRLLKAIHRFRYLRFLPPLNKFWPFGQRLHKLVFGGSPSIKNAANRDVMVAAYREYNARVRTTVPPERLLEFNVRQGWEPLCNFLGFEVPSTPFPHLNSGIAGPTKIIASALRRLSALPAIAALSGLLLVAAMLQFFVKMTNH